MALTQAGAAPPAARLATVAVVLTPIVSHSFGRSTYGLLLPAMEDDLRLDHAQAGLGGTTTYAAYLLGVVLVAGFARRVEPITIMRAGLACGAAGLAVLAVADGLVLLFSGLALAGLAGAGIWIPAPAIATAAVDERRRGVVIGSLSAAIGAATFLVGVGTAGMRAATGDQGAWRGVWAAEAVVALALLVGSVLIVRPRATAAVGGRLNLDQLRAIPSWRRITAAYALFAAVGAGFAPFLVEALEDDVGLSRGAASTLWATMGVAAIAGAPAFGGLSDRFGRRPVMVGVLLAAASGPAALAVASPALVVAAVLVFGSVWSSYPTLTAAYVRDHADARVFGTAFATMTIFYSLAALAAPSTVGLLAERTDSFALPFGGLAGFCLLAAALLATVPGEHRPGRARRRRPDSTRPHRTTADADPDRQPPVSPATGPAAPPPGPCPPPDGRTARWTRSPRPSRPPGSGA